MMRPVHQPTTGQLKRMERPTRASAGEASLLKAILLANWFHKACLKALEGDAKRKYFEHAGALLTADGTDDDLIKLEGVPPGYKLVIPSYGY